MRDPAFLFYPSDFLTGVSDLTMEERGQYITLLCIEHQKGRFTEKMVALCCGKATVDVLSKFSIDENGLYFNARLEKEIQKRKEHSEKQRNRALEGWKKRKENDATALATVDATALPLVNRNVNVNKDINTNEIKEEKFNFKKSLLNYGFEESLVSDWLLVRKNKKATNTETSFKTFISELEKRPCDKNEILKTIVVKNWAGFKWEWIDNQSQNNNSFNVPTQQQPQQPKSRYNIHGK